MSEPTAAEPQGVEAQVFHFRYTVFTVAATLDAERLMAKVGIRTIQVPIARLQQVYVRDERRSDHVELLLTHLDDKGRLRRARLFADKREAGFEALIEALLARRPEADVRHLSASEAYRLSGSKEAEWVALPAVMLLGWLVLAVLLSPLMRHGFDDGAATVAASAFAEPHGLTTRNVTVTGTLAPGSALRSKQGATEGAWWVPVVPPSWRPGEAVYAVLKVPRRTAAQIDALAQTGRFEGILRDIWWEGLSERRRQAFHARGVALAPTAVLIDFEANRRADLVVAGVVLGGLGLVVLVVAIRLRRRRTAAQG